MDHASKERDWTEFFEPKPIEEKFVEDLKTVRRQFQRLAETIQNEVNMPNGRYKSIVLTKLEEAAMFATKAFSHN